MKKPWLLFAFALVAACGDSAEVETASPGSTVVSSPIAAANDAAAGLPRVKPQCSAGDEATGYAFDAENGGLATADGALADAVSGRSELPSPEFRRAATTDDAVQFTFPATGPARAVVVVTRTAQKTWRVHSLRGCRSLVLLPGEG